MKSIQKIVSVLLLTIVYCLSISMSYAHSEKYASLEFQKILSKKDSAQKFVPTNQNSFDFQLNFGNSFDKSNKSTKENNLFKTTTFRSENSIFSQIKQYVFHSNKLLIRIRKNDYIFPSHYFW